MSAATPPPEEPPGGSPADPGRLDPDRAIEAARRAAGARPEFPRAEPVIDTRRYQRMIGGFGLLLLVAFSIYLYARGGSTTPGVPPGQRLHNFVAPLATSDLDVPANPHPRCNPRRPARRGLNVCGRRPIVLGFFVLGSARCEREVTALQAVYREFPRLTVAAVAVNAGRRGTDRAVRAHHWTIPVAYDSSGVIGELYGVVVCPIVELAGRGGVVSARLIGEGWDDPARLEARVRRFARSQRIGSAS
jgi:hypothetical protein